MGFDISTATPVGGGFDLSTAVPVSQWDNQSQVIPLNQELYGNDLNQFNGPTSTMDNLASGILKGVSRFGTTALWPYDAAKDYLTGSTNPISSHQQRINQIDNTLMAYGDPNSLAFKGGDLGTQILGTAGAGGAVANGVRALDATGLYGLNTLAPLANAIESGGMKLGGQAANTLGGLLANGGTRMLGGAINGAATAGLIDPNNAGTGAAFGAALPAVTGLIGSVGGAAKNAIIDPIFNKTGMIKNFLSDSLGQDLPNVINALSTKQAYTPGVNFTASQLTGDPLFAAMEDAISNKMPNSVIGSTNATNRTALKDSLLNLYKSPEAISQGIADRSTITTPLYDAARNSTATVDPTSTINLIDRITANNPKNTGLLGVLGQVRDSLFEPYPLESKATDAWNAIDGSLGGRMSDADMSALQGARRMMSQVKSGSLAPEDAINNLNNLNLSSKTAQSAIDQATAILKTPDNVVSQSPLGVMSAMENLKALMGGQNDNHILSELSSIKDSLNNQLTNAVPEYAQANSTFKNLSQPINQMQVGQYLFNKLVPSTAGDMPVSLNAGNLATALRNPDQVAATATGFNRARLNDVLTPEQLNMVNGVNADASTMANAAKMGMGTGSATYKRIATDGFLNNTLNNQGLIQSIIGAGLTHIPFINKINSSVNNNIMQRLDGLLANPQDLAALLSKPNSNIGGLLNQYSLGNPMIRNAGNLLFNPAQ